MTSSHTAITASPPAPAAQTAQSINALQAGQNPYKAHLNELHKAVIRYDAQFGIRAVKDGKCPPFLALVGHLFPTMAVSELRMLIASDGNLPPSAIENPKDYLAKREAIEGLLVKFNELRETGEPAATLETLAAFLEAKQQQGRLLGHELRNPFIAAERYAELYPLIARQVDEETRKLTSKDFGVPTDSMPKDADPNASLPLYRMYDIGKLVAVASGHTVAFGCQQSGSCLTAVGADFIGGMPIEKAYGFLSARGSLLKPEVRAEQAKLISDQIYGLPGFEMLEKYGKDENERPRNEQDAQPRPENQEPKRDGNRDSYFQEGALPSPAIRTSTPAVARAR